MNWKRAGMVAVALVAVGATAQVTRDEFNTLVQQVTTLEQRVQAIEAQGKTDMTPSGWRRVAQWQGFAERPRFSVTGQWGGQLAGQAMGSGGGSHVGGGTVGGHTITVAAPWRVRCEGKGYGDVIVRGFDGRTTILLARVDGNGEQTSPTSHNPGKYQISIEGNEWYRVTVEEQAEPTQTPPAVSAIRP